MSICSRNTKSWATWTSINSPVLFLILPTSPREKWSLIIYGSTKKSRKLRADPSNNSRRSGKISSDGTDHFTLEEYHPDTSDKSF